MARGDGEYGTYFFITGLFITLGVMLLGLGIWFHYNTEYFWEGYAGIICGAVILFFGIALLLAGIFRKLDERRWRTDKARRGSRKRLKKGRR